MSKQRGGRLLKADGTEAASVLQPGKDGHILIAFEGKGSANFAVNPVDVSPQQILMAGEYIAELAREMFRDQWHQKRMKAIKDAQANEAIARAVQDTIRVKD